MLQRGFVRRDDQRQPLEDVAQVGLRIHPRGGGRGLSDVGTRWSSRAQGVVHLYVSDPITFSESFFHAFASRRSSAGRSSVTACWLG